MSDSVENREMASAGISGDSRPGIDVLLEELGKDRVWLLRQLDSGRWPEWRLDLAALERELGQVLEQARQRMSGE